jgi:hypothetical protein
VGICAWCLRDCGADAHPHVPHCTESGRRGGLFGTKADFHAHHKARRLRLVRERVAREAPAVQAHLQRLLAADLRDLQ